MCFLSQLLVEDSNLTGTVEVRLKEMRRKNTKQEAPSKRGQKWREGREKGTKKEQQWHTKDRRTLFALSPMLSKKINTCTGSRIKLFSCFITSTGNTGMKFHVNYIS